MPQATRRRADVGGSLPDAAAQGGQGAAPGVRKSREALPLPSVTLPTAKRKVSVDLHNRVTFIYGPPKIGKSTLASEFGEVLFFELEPGLDDLEVYSTGHIADWLTFCAFVNEVTKPDAKKYDAFVVDTCDLLAERCSEHTNTRLGIMHESELDWGMGWSAARKELTRWINKLASVPDTGLILVSHSQIREIKERNAAYDKTIPTLAKGARSAFLDMSDIILLADYEGEGAEERRVLRAGASRYHEAGARGDRLPAIIEWPKGGGYAALVAAWNGGGK